MLLRVGTRLKVTSFRVDTAPYRTVRGNTVDRLLQTLSPGVQHKLAPLLALLRRNAWRW